MHSCLLLETEPFRSGQARRSPKPGWLLGAQVASIRRLLPDPTETVMGRT